MNHIENSISMVSKNEKVLPHNVVRDYFLGITASVADDINRSMATNEKPKPTIIGGTALRKAYFLSYPRYTSDVDFEADINFYRRNNRSILENYQNTLVEIADGVRQKVVSVYGNDHNFEPRIIKLIQPVNNDGKKFGSLKGDIFIPHFFGWEAIYINMETATKKNTSFIPLETTPLIHNFIDSKELNLKPIEVQAISNIFSNKICSALKRLSKKSDESSRISRIKDIFDIWYIGKGFTFKDEQINIIFKKRIQEEKKAGENTDIIINTAQEIIKSPYKYFSEITTIIGKYVNSVRFSSDDEKMKRMTKGIIDNFKFPTAKELIDNFRINLLKLEL